MKFFIAFVALIVAAAAAPAGLSPEGDAVILKDVRVNDGVNGYQFGFETSNGISQEEIGSLKVVNDIPVIVVQGISSYTSPEGLQVVLKYAADENGYQPVVPIV